MFAVVHERVPGDLLSVSLFLDFDKALHHCWAMSFEGEATGLGIQCDAFNQRGDCVGYQAGDQRWRVTPVHTANYLVAKILDEGQAAG